MRMIEHRDAHVRLVKKEIENFSKAINALHNQVRSNKVLNSPVCLPDST